VSGYPGTAVPESARGAKDLKIIVRYCGLETFPALYTPRGEPPDTAHVFRIVMGFAGEPATQTLEYREPSRVLASLYPNNPESQFVIALGQALRSAASHFEGLVIVNQETPASPPGGARGAPGQ
jgi:hypothetical protein